MLDWSLVLRFIAGAFAVLGLISAWVEYRRFVKDMRELERTLDDPNYVSEYWAKTKTARVAARAENSLPQLKGELR